MLGVLFQAIYFYLLYNAPAKPLVLLVIPFCWCLKNIGAVYYLFTDQFLGWIPIGTLFSWILSALFLPTIVGLGTIAGIVDSTSIEGSFICVKAKEIVSAAGISPSQIISYCYHLITNVFKVVSSDIFNEQYLEYVKSRSIFDTSLYTSTSTTYWLILFGFSVTCLF